MTTKQRNEILENACPQEWWESCYIAEDNMIFTPRFDEEGNELANGEQVYNEWIDQNNKSPEPSKMEVLEKKVAELEEEKELLNKENKLLHAQVEVLSNTTDFHEELITEMAMKVYA